MDKSITKLFTNVFPILEKDYRDVFYNELCLSASENLGGITVTVITNYLTDFYQNKFQNPLYEVKFKKYLEKYILDNFQIVVKVKII